MRKAWELDQGPHIEHPGGCLSVPGYRSSARRWIWRPRPHCHQTAWQKVGMAEGRHGRRARRICVLIVSEHDGTIPKLGTMKSRFAVTVVPSRSARSQPPSSAT